MKHILTLLSFLFITQTSLASDVALFGFVSQSAVKSNNVSIGGSDGKWSFAKRELNLFGDMLIPSIDSTFRFGVGTTDEPGLEEHKLVVKYALIDTRIGCACDKVIWGLRAGRVPHTLGFYNPTRNAPATGQFIYQPEGIYREQFKWLAMSGDGVQGYVYHSFNKDTYLDLTATLTKANLIANREVVAGHFGNVGVFDEDKSYVRGVTAELRHKNTNFYYNWINLNFWLKPDFNVLPEGRTDTNVHVIGARQYHDKFSYGIEYMKVITKGKVWDAIRAPIKNQGAPTGFVVSFTYYLMPKLDISAYHTQYYLANKDKTGENLSAAYSMPSTWFYTKANSLAAKYKINEKYTIKVQYTKGTGKETFIRSLNQDDHKRWDYLASQLIYTF